MSTVGRRYTFKNETITEVLLENNADPNQKDSSDQTPLHWASQQGNEKLVNSLLDKGADLDVEDKNGKTPLDLATRCGHSAVVELLLDKGVNPERWVITN